MLVLQIHWSADIICGVYAAVAWCWLADLAAPTLDERIYAVCRAICGPPSTEDTTKRDFTVMAVVFASFLVLVFTGTL
jgi:hypothetical protein